MVGWVLAWTRRYEMNQDKDLECLDTVRVTVDRSKWQRGESGHGRLLTDVGKMCCIGFVCKAMGAKDEDMLGRMTPASADRYADGGLPRRLNHMSLPPVGLGTRLIHPREGIEGSFSSAPEVATAMGLNDDPAIGDEEREADIKAVLREIAIEVEFVG